MAPSAHMCLHRCETNLRAEPLLVAIFEAAFAANTHVPTFIFFLVLFVSQALHRRFSLF